MIEFAIFWTGVILILITIVGIADLTTSMRYVIKKLQERGSVKGHR